MPINRHKVRPEVTIYRGTSRKYNFDFISTFLKLIQLKFLAGKIFVLTDAINDFWLVSLRDLGPLQANFVVASHFTIKRDNCNFIFLYKMRFKFSPIRPKAVAPITIDCLSVYDRTQSWNRPQDPSFMRTFLLFTFNGTVEVCRVT